MYVCKEVLSVSTRKGTDICVETSTSHRDPKDNSSDVKPFWLPPRPGVKNMVQRPCTSSGTRSIW